MLATAKQHGWSLALFSSKERKELEEQSRVVDRPNMVKGETWLTPNVVKNLDGAVDEDW